MAEEPEVEMWRAPLQLSVLSCRLNGCLLTFKRHSESVDDAAKKFKQFSDATELFCLKDKREEDVVYLLSHKWAKTEKFAVETMQNRLQKVPFAWVFAVEKFK